MSFCDGEEEVQKKVLRNKRSRPFDLCWEEDATRRTSRALYTGLGISILQSARVRTKSEDDGQSYEPRNTSFNRSKEVGIRSIFSSYHISVRSVDGGLIRSMFFLSSTSAC